MSNQSPKIHAYIQQSMLLENKMFINQDFASHFPKYILSKAEIWKSWCRHWVM